MQQSSGLQLAAASGDAQLEGMRAGCDCIFITMNDEPRSDLLGKPVAEFNHLFKFVSGIDVKEGKGKRPGIKRLARKVDKHARILADRVKQNGVAQLRNGLPQNIK